MHFFFLFKSFTVRNLIRYIFDVQTHSVGIKLPNLFHVIIIFSYVK